MSNKHPRLMLPSTPKPHSPPGEPSTVSNAMNAAPVLAESMEQTSLIASKDFTWISPGTPKEPPPPSSSQYIGSQVANGPSLKRKADVLVEPSTPAGQIIRSSQDPPSAPVKPTKFQVAAGTPPTAPKMQPPRTPIKSLKGPGYVAQNSISKSPSSRLPTPIVRAQPASQFQSLFIPAPAPRPHAFELGQEVFLLDEFRNSVSCTATVNLGILRIGPRSPFDYKTLPVRFAFPNVYFVAKRFAISEKTKPGLQSPGYTLAPVDGRGGDRYVRQDVVMAVRYRPGARVWYLGKNRQGNLKRAESLVVSTEVIRGKRFYNIHVILRRFDEYLVSDEMLEEFRWR